MMSRRSPQSKYIIRGEEEVSASDLAPSESGTYENIQLESLDCSLYINPAGKERRKTNKKVVAGFL